MKPAMICGALAALLLLCSCGGGGSSSTRDGSSATNVLYDDPHSPEALLGATRLNISQSQIEAASERLLRQATALLFDEHDPGAFSGRIRSNCQGEVCFFSSADRYSLTDFASSDSDDGDPVDCRNIYLYAISYRGTQIVLDRGTGTVPKQPSVIIDVNEAYIWLDYTYLIAVGNRVSPVPPHRSVQAR